MGFNKVIIQGNVTRDPEMKEISNGRMAKFGFAWNQPGRNGERTAHYYDVVVMGKTAEFVEQYVKSGSALIVDGELRQQRWEDKDTGKNRSKHEIFVGFGGSINFSGGRRDEESEGEPARASAAPASEGGGGGEDSSLF